MALWKVFIMAAMPLLSYTGLSGMAGTASRNGLLDLLRNGSAAHSSPAGAFTVPTRLLKSMVRFFTPIVSLKHAGVSLQGTRFLTIWMSIWLVMNVEAMRGNQADPSKRLIAVFGLLMEFIGVGVVLPVWILINIWFSHTPSAQRDDLVAHPDDIKTMAWSLLVGAGIPTLLMYCGSSQASNILFSGQFWIVVRLFHPITSWLVHKILRPGPARSRTTLPTAEATASAEKLRQLSQTAFWMATVAHILSIVSAGTIQLQRAISLTSEQQAPLWPPLVSPRREWPVKIESLEEGIGIFLFWDEVVATMTVYLWALAISGLGGDGQSLYAVRKALRFSVVAGPAAVAIDTIWQR